MRCSRTPQASFVLIYQPVVNGPNLGLSMVDLNDGSYSTTKIYRSTTFR